MVARACRLLNDLATPILYRSVDISENPTDGPALVLLTFLRRPYLARLVKEVGFPRDYKWIHASDQIAAQFSDIDSELYHKLITEAGVDPIDPTASYFGFRSYRPMSQLQDLTFTGVMKFATTGCFLTHFTMLRKFRYTQSHDLDTRSESDGPIQRLRPSKIRGCLLHLTICLEELTLLETGTWRYSDLHAPFGSFVNFTFLRRLTTNAQILLATSMDTRPLRLTDILPRSLEHLSISRCGSHALDQIGDLVSRKDAVTPKLRSLIVGCRKNLFLFNNFADRYKAASVAESLFHGIELSFLDD